MKKLKHKLETAFIQTKEIPYYLHAIMIHQGYADSGHYYAFIYDRKSKTWWRFNDHTVTKESEEVVFSESYGGGQPKTAYCLIYINEYVAQQLNKKSLLELYSSGIDIDQ